RPRLSPGHHRRRLRLHGRDGLRALSGIARSLNHLAPPMHYLIAHYHELALKGRNRPFLVDRLVRNLRQALRGTSPCHLERLAGRIRISLDDPTQWSTIKTRLDAVFRPANFPPAVHVSSDLEFMSKTGRASL